MDKKKRVKPKKAGIRRLVIKKNDNMIEENRDNEKVSQG